MAIGLAWRRRIVGWPPSSEQCLHAEKVVFKWLACRAGPHPHSAAERDALLPLDYNYSSVRLVTELPQ